MELNKTEVQYPCPNNTDENIKLTSIEECNQCSKQVQCDIYATMLDEIYDME